MTPSLGERLRAASEALKSVSDSPRTDAEILLAHALGIPRKRLPARLDQSPDAPRFDEYVQRRLDYEPVPYILGEWEFFSLELAVEAPMLVPRPETEHLVETVLDFIGDAPARVLELGTGTGCVAIAIAANAPNCRVWATDINEQALDLARRNAVRHQLSERIAFARGDLFEAVQDDAPFDAICSNPPYVEEEAWPTLSPIIRLYEDPRALLAGTDGLDIIRRLVHEAKSRLRPGGLLAFEIGMGQDTAVGRLLETEGYESIAFHRDLAGIRRVAAAQRPRS